MSDMPLTRPLLWLNQCGVLWREHGKGKVCLARWSEVGTCSSSSEAKPHVSSNGPRPAKLLAKVLKQSDAISPTKDPSTSKPHGVALESFIVSDSDDRR